MSQSESEEFAKLVHGFRANLEQHYRQGLREVPAGSLGPITEFPGEPELETLEGVRADLGECQRCPLHTSRNSIVFGAGDANADLLFVGEAPGAREDEQGLPFVGPAGELLGKMIVAMGWSRETVYIANVLKCRPPGNRDPKAEEIEQCESFLARQIAAISPKVIVTLGKPAAHLLLKSKASMGALRGNWHSLHGVMVMPTYHPAYLLREPAQKKAAWGDLQLVMKQLQELGIAPKKTL